MRILRGGSTEIRSNEWFKFDVELDESDLQALVIKHAIDYEKLTVIQKFQFLSLQAEIFVTAQMESRGASGETSLKNLQTNFENFIAKLPKVA